MQKTGFALAIVGVLGLAACSEVVTPTVVQTTARAVVDRGNLGVSPSTALLVPGQTERYVALASQIFTKDLAAVSWSVENPAIASVSADGTLTAHTNGFTWLRAQGPDGRAAHPISVSTEPVATLTGRVRTESCTADAAVTCSMIMKSAGSLMDLQLRYRKTQGLVVAEFWYGNDMNTSALVGEEVATGELRFNEPALLTPVVSRGAGGCCTALSEITASSTAGLVTAGGFKSTSASHVLRFRMVQ